MKNSRKSHYTDAVRTFKSNEQTVCHLLVSFIYVSYLLSVPPSVPTTNRKWGTRAPLCPMVSAPMPDVPDRVVFKLAVTVRQAAHHRRGPICRISTASHDPGLQCRHAPASAFRQPSPTCRTAFPAQHLRLSGVLSRWPDGLELTAGLYPGSNEQHRLF